MTGSPSDTPTSAEGTQTILLGLVATPGLAADTAAALASELPDLLSERVSDRVAWAIRPVVDERIAEDDRDTAATIDLCRERMLQEGWSFAVCLTDLPLRDGRRPVVADVSAMHGVARVSLPALGALHLRRRAGGVIAQLLDGLVGARMRGGTQGAATDLRRRRRVGHRLVELAAPIRRVLADDDDIDVRLVAAVARGHLRLIAGMVRANRPWRLIVGLGRALVAALGAVAFAIVTSDIWRLADALDAARLSVLTVASIVATVVSLIAAHELWERAPTPRARERVTLFNLASTLTVTLGIVSLYVGLFVITLAASALVIDDGVLAQTIGHHAGLGDYVRLAWLVSSLATVGGALGASLESDATVRRAAYAHRSPEDHE